MDAIIEKEKRIVVACMQRLSCRKAKKNSHFFLKIT